MARRYSRREFLTDASFALCSSVLLKVLAPKALDTETPLAEKQAQSPASFSQSANMVMKKG